MSRSRLLMSIYFCIQQFWLDAMIMRSSVHLNRLSSWWRLSRYILCRGIIIIVYSHGITQGDTRRYRACTNICILYLCQNKSTPSTTIRKATTFTLQCCHIFPPINPYSILWNYSIHGTFLCLWMNCDNKTVSNYISEKRYRDKFTRLTHETNYTFAISLQKTSFTPFYLHTPWN